MSLATWTAKFYPVTVVHVSKKTAAAHALRKWEGFRRQNRNAHQVGAVLLQQAFSGTSTCALCSHYFKIMERPQCQHCPLTKVRNGAPCWNTRDDERDSPYHAWMEKTNPLPMIHWLKKAVKSVAETHKSC